MKLHLPVLLLLAAACSKEAPKAPVPDTGSSNAAALKQLQAQREAPPENHATTVGGDDLDRMAAFSSVKLPDTPGNPTSHSVCVTLYDKSGRAVAAEGQFEVTSDLSLGGGVYVYPPMFGPLDFPGNSSPLGACPASGGMWPDRAAQVRGKTFPIQVKFTSASGKVLTADTSQAF